MYSGEFRGSIRTCARERRRLAGPSPVAGAVRFTVDRLPAGSYIEVMLDLPLLSATLRDCGRKLPRTHSVGGAEDWSDLYYLIDYLTFALDRAYESQPCRDGCSLCCREYSIFRVTAAEWATISALLDDRGEGTAGLLERNQATYGAYRDQLQRVAESWQGDPSLSATNPHLEGLPPVCPALVDDRCSIYDARPLICRAYGYFAVKVRDKDTLMICKVLGRAFVDSLREQGLEHAPLPNFEPFDRQVRRLNGTGAIKPLPLWLLERADGRSS